MVHNNSVTLLLASQSPRRRALLKEMGYAVKIVNAPNIDEVFPEHLTAGDIPLFIAEQKAKAYDNILLNNEMLVTADTIVWLNNEVIGKPIDRNDAIAMLTKLSGNVHQVFTGICLTYLEKTYLFCDETKVFFRQLSNNEIVYYVDNYKPYDKAGAYGVQEWIGFVGVERIEGSYFNVMGLPIHRLYAEIKGIIEMSK